MYEPMSLMISEEIQMPNLIKTFPRVLETRYLVKLIDLGVKPEEAKTLARLFCRSDEYRDPNVRHWWREWAKLTKHRINVATVADVYNDIFMCGTRVWFDVEIEPEFKNLSFKYSDYYKLSLAEFRCSYFEFRLQ